MIVRPAGPRLNRVLKPQAALCPPWPGQGTGQGKLCARTLVCVDRAACGVGCSLSPQPHRTWYPSLGQRCIRSSWRVMWKVGQAQCWSGEGEVTLLYGGRSVWPKGGGKVRTAHRHQCLGDQEAPEMRLQPRNWGLPGPSASHIRVPAHGVAQIHSS